MPVGVGGVEAEVSPKETRLPELEPLVGLWTDLCFARTSAKMSADDFGPDSSATASPCTLSSRTT